MLIIGFLILICLALPIFAIDFRQYYTPTESIIKIYEDGSWEYVDISVQDMFKSRTREYPPKYLEYPPFYIKSRGTEPASDFFGTCEEKDEKNQLCKIWYCTWNIRERFDGRCMISRKPIEICDKGEFRICEEITDKIPTITYTTYIYASTIKVVYKEGANIDKCKENLEKIPSTFYENIREISVSNIDIVGGINIKAKSIAISQSCDVNHIIDVLARYDMQWKGYSTEEEDYMQEEDKMREEE